jgi:hypothetical protein
VNGNVLKIQENLTTTSQDTFKFKIDKIVQINEACVGCIHPNYTNSWWHVVYTNYFFDYNSKKIEEKL